MKFVCLFFAVVFLCRAQADEADVNQAEKEQEEDLKDLSAPQDEDPALPAGDEVSEDEGSGPKASKRLAIVLCNRNKGYCLPRGYLCDTGLVFKEPWNNCPSRNAMKCCVR